MRFPLLFAIVLLTLAGCASPTASSVKTVKVPASLTMSGSSPEVQTAAAASSDRQAVSLSLDLGSTTKNVYFVLTNESASASTSGMPSISGAGSAAPPRSVAASRPVVGRQPRMASPTPEFVRAANDAAAAALNAAPSNRSAVSPSYDSSPTSPAVIGMTTAQYIPAGGTSGSAVTCTLEAVVDQSSGAQARKLFVWVANTCLDPNTTTAGTYTYSTQTSASSIPFKVTQAQAQALAAAFLNNNSTNFLNSNAPGDIYRYDTSIYGVEYPGSGQAPASNLITPQGEIHIFIVDLNSTSTEKGDGGVLGYFYASDDFTSSTYSDSNQKIMFQLDAECLGNPTTDGGFPSFTGTGLSSPTWSLSTSYWPNQILSTLAHEFQHMIHFYQKQISNNLSSATATWINEMCSVVTEDFVGSDIGSLGPRGVEFTSHGDAFAYSALPGSLMTFTGTSAITITSATYNDYSSRVAFFNNYYPTVSLEGWGDTGTGNLANYGMAFAFGSWLARNYGGPTLFHKIVSNPYTDEQAVVSAVNTVNTTNYTMPQLIEQWAAAMVMGPQATTAPYALVSTSGDGYFTASPIQTVQEESANTFQYGSIDPSTYYPLSYDASSGSSSLGSSTGGPLIFTNFSGVSSIPARAFYYYTPSTGTLTGSQTYVVTIPPHVHFDVVTVPSS